MANRRAVIFTSVFFIFAFTAALAYPGGAQAQQKRTLTVMLHDFSDAATREIISDDLVPRFEAMHPGVEVDVQWASWDGYVARYVTLYLGDKLPDVVNVGSSALGQFANQGIIQPIEQYMRDWSELDDFIPAALQDSQIDGVFWAMPYVVDVRTLAYNRLDFDEAGLDRDKPPTNWDELEEFAKRLTKRDADGVFIREGFDVRATVQRVLPFVLQAGGGYISADGKRTLLAENEAVEAVQYMSDFIHVSQVSRAASSGLVGQNLASMAYEGTWLMQSRWDDYDLGVADPTQFRKQSTNAHINRFGISRTAKDPDLAWEWIKFMVEPENAGLLLQASLSFPSRISALQGPVYSGDTRWQNYLNAALIAEPVPGWVPALANVVGEAEKAYWDIFNNNVPVRTRLEEMARYVDEYVLNE